VSAGKKRTIYLSQSKFISLTLQQNLISNLEILGYDFMTPIQAQSLPAILDNRDVIGQAKTGSGKTAAFGLGLLNKLDVQQFRIQALVLCPTRELADQVAQELRKLARMIHNIKILTLCGGMPLGPQIGSLEHGAHIIVGTPGRIEEHLRKSTLTLDHLTTLVLDEADRMLDMGFQPAVDAIVEQAPKQRQTLLFSATYPPEIRIISHRIMVNPVVVQLTSTHDNDSIEQLFYLVSGETSRLTALQLLLMKYQPESCLVFCNTRIETQEVADALAETGFSALALHGDLEQRQRDQALVRFTNKSVSILVATDVAARGLDITALDTVINYQLSRDPEVHIHRIGRTGRAGNKGIACTLYTEKEQYKIARLADLQRRPVNNANLPSTSLLNQAPYQPPMATLQIDGGKKQKVRPGDILGALTGDQGIGAHQVGKIHIFDNSAYVAVEQSIAKKALQKIGKGKLKGRAFRVRRIRG
jgi:ATP-dependent RNA helicase DbpA